MTIWEDIVGCTVGRRWSDDNKVAVDECKETHGGMCGTTFIRLCILMR